MLNRKALLALALLLATGCANQQKMLDRVQATAIHTAVDRGQFEMNCSSATGAIISREIVKPSQMQVVNGIPGAEYTIGVEGCKKRTTYVVDCPLGGNGCFINGWVHFIGKQQQ